MILGLNSIFIKDYNNDMGLDPWAVRDYFNGYCDYIYEIAENEGNGDNWLDYDTNKNLKEWYYVLGDWDIKEGDNI